MNRLSMMPWFPESFVAATRGWTLLERGLYRELLDAQWIQGSLPADEVELMRLAGATKSDWAKAWPTVKKKFAFENGEFKNKRLEEHRLKANKLNDQRRTSAQKTNAQRYGVKSDSARSASRSASPPANGLRDAERSHDTDTDTDALRPRGFPRREVC